MSTASRLDLLHTLLEREQRRRDEALLAWQQAGRQAEQAREQASALGTYRSQYHQRWSAQFTQAAPIEIVRCYQGFVGRLDQAISTQAAQVQQAEQRHRLAHDKLRQRELKVATVRRMIERRQAALLLAAQRRDQKASDEAAQRLGWAQRNALAAG